MWTEITRANYDRSDLRYASDLTDAEWALIEPFLPPGKRLARISHQRCNDFEIGSDRSSSNG